MSGFRIALIDPQGSEADEGEIAIALQPAPTGLMSVYLDSAERAAELLGGRYYRTSDVASWDGDGYFWYVGRADDVFKSSDLSNQPVRAGKRPHRALRGRGGGGRSEPGPHPPVGAEGLYRIEAGRGLLARDGALAVPVSSRASGPL